MTDRGLSIQPENIPAELKQQHRWVGYNDEQYVSCRTGSPVRSNSESEFVSFPEALACHRERKVQGIAFAATDGFLVLRDLPYHDSASKKRVHNLDSYT